MSKRDQTGGAADPGTGPRAGNLFSWPADPRLPGAEAVETLLSRPGLRLERILSHGEASPEGFWYDQEQVEWVVVLAGAAGVLIAGEAAPRTLGPGDYLELPAHCRHRVAWTDPDRPTLWLALHGPGGEPPAS